MKAFLSFIFVLAGGYGFAQGDDYRTTEDGINKLLSNPAFVKEVLELDNQSMSLDKLSNYFVKYAPEYIGFKPTGNTIDETKLYYTGAGQLSATDMVGVLGPALNMNTSQVSNLQKALTGNLQSMSTSADVSGLFYKRGVDKKMDFAIDAGVDFFQRKMGTAGLQSGLVSMAGGVLGSLAAKWNARAAEKEAAEAIMFAKLSDRSVYITGFDPKAAQQDLVIHQKANMKAGLSPMAGSWTPIDYISAIKDYDRVIELYAQNPDRAYYMYLALMQRGAAKMSVGAYRGAVTDYYMADNLVQNMINKTLPDESIDVTWPPGYYDASNKQAYLKGKMNTMQFTVGYKDQLLTMIARSFAKYRTGDYTGALADSKLATDLQTQKRIAKTGLPNDYRDVVVALQAMSEFGLGKYEAAITSFTKANLNEELIADDDVDGVTDFMDWDHRGLSGILDSAEGLNFTVYVGLPRFFPFDISQIRGLALYKAGKIDEAIMVYENIVASETSIAPLGGGQRKTFTKIGGDISAVYSSLSSFYAAKGDAVKAVEFIDKALLLNPDYKEYLIKKESYDSSGSSTAKTTPSSATTKGTKALDYYLTKHEGLLASGQKEEAFTLLMEAAGIYPEKFAVSLMSLIKDLKDPTRAENAAALYADPVLRAVFKAHQYNLAGDRAGEYQALTQAFDKGLHFQDAAKYKLELTANPAYCSFLKTYATTENNNLKLRPAEADKMKRSLDSIALEQANDPRMQDKMVRKMMAEMRVKQEAKLFGSAGQYLKLLQEGENKFAAAPNEVLDQIECLIILKREEEAVKFANKIIKSKKMDAVTQYVTDELTKSWVTAIHNIAAGACSK